ncbi:MAG TPA: hypothetical protein VFF79_17815 [Conexibacter sp.]|jgi:hypothetical protein|nr:hypothetical protein [Conexibacter sp.]
MQSIRTARIATAAAAATLLLAGTASATAVPGLTTAIRASVSPNHLVRGLTNAHGMPITLKVAIDITHPAGSRYQLQRVIFKFPNGVGKPNGNLFPSCSAATLLRAHNRLSACPRGSLVGRGRATGTAVDIGVTSSGALTLFNGPGGKSIVFNVNIITPALINDTFTAPLQKTSGRFGYVLTNPIPTDLQNILDGPIIVRHIDVTTGLTRVVRGVRRGYIEAFKCPKSHKAPVHADFFFSQGATSSADSNIACH